MRAQSWDYPARINDEIARGTESFLQFSFEQRGRYETHGSENFGNSPDLSVGLIRTRLGVTLRPAPWITFSAMAQDARVPWYGPGAPSGMRDQADLQEAYLELFPAAARGFGLSAGRRMLDYGDGRLIGAPQWSNTSRTFDHVRLSYRWPRARLEFLAVSIVKVRIGEFDRPQWGDRVWGTYDVFPRLIANGTLEAYLLRHDANGSRLAVNTAGARVTGPLRAGWRYTLEGALQNGRVGPATHKAAAWVSTVSRHWSIAQRSMDLSGEYKYASGTADPRYPTRDTTFDQLYAANHDKFGREDLFGWRNLHDLRALFDFAATKRLAVHSMYNELWLASARDALYNGQGIAITRSPDGVAGRHVGRETDVFLTWTYAHFTLGAGYGYLFPGAFLRGATRGVGPSYAYLFHSYAF